MFDTNKISHIHPCECHVIESLSMKDQNGKTWSLEDLDLHVEGLKEIEE